MSNSIAKFKNYTSLLDEVFKNAILTSDLMSPASTAKEGNNANEIIVNKISMDGLGNYSRNSGYVGGDVTLTQETVAFNYERGRMFTVDTMDNEETAGIAYGQLAGEFIRTKVAPEADAFLFATLASEAGIGSASGALTTSNVIAAISSAIVTMDEAEVPQESRYLYVTPTVHRLIMDLDTTKSKQVLDGFAKIIKVPQSRFYTAITMNDGTTDGQTAGGYTKDATNGKDINFMIVEKSALLYFNKHVAPKVIRPEDNQTADAWKYGYRKYGLVDVYENKVAGIYVHHKTA